MCLVVDMAILGCSEPWFSGILASPLSGYSDLWASLLGGSELWVYGILARNSKLRELTPSRAQERTLQ
jgi:hypothetical protein